MLKAVIFDVYGVLTEVAPAVVKKICDELNQAGLKLGAASISSHQFVESTLRDAGVFEYFETIVASGDVARSKPDPAVYVEAAKQLDIEPKDCIAIEDSPSGITSAKAAGVTCIAVTYTHSRDQLEAADIIVDSLEEVIESIFARNE